MCICVGEPTCPRVLHVRDEHEVSCDVPLVLAVLVGSHQCINTIVDVCGDIELQTAVVLALRRHMDLSLDVVLLLQRLALVVPHQLRFWVSRHTEWDAPILVAHGFVQVQDNRWD